jgi:hypothetical protein
VVSGSACLALAPIGVCAASTTHDQKQWISALRLHKPLRAIIRSLRTETSCQVIASRLMIGPAFEQKRRMSTGQ